MQKVIIKYLSGSKSNQTETFEFPIKELIIGRDAKSQVIFDPEKDDLVSRLHCKITVQNDDQFFLTDLNSRNGTFVNSQKITAPLQIYAGDTVQLGKGGPQFAFDLDPRPKSAPKATRFGDTALEAPLTREHSLDLKPIPPAPDKIEPMLTSMATVDQTKPTGIGRNTVERLITQAESNTKKKMINIGAGIIGIVILISGFFIFQNYQNKSELERTLASNTQNQENKLAELKSNQQLSAADISKQYSNSIVYIEASWKLIDIQSGKQIFQQKTCIEKNKKGQCVSELPSYFSCKGTVEPLLDFDSGIPIGESLTGSGFVVNENGYIMTNRHVGATWHTQYTDFYLPGILLTCKNAACTDLKSIVLRSDSNDPNVISYVRSLKHWVPSKTKCFRKTPLSGKIVEGRHDSLEVTFPKTQLRIPAKPVRVSDTADVALIKVDIPEALQPVQLNSQDVVSAGDAITVMGYPAVSPKALVKINSQDPLNPESELREIPDPTVTPGNIGRVIRGNADILSEEVSGYYSEMGDVYQLTANATGSGNSGGPVFNGKGHVIGIFTYSGSDQSGTKITFAVPIKHGEEIMGVKQVIE